MRGGIRVILGYGPLRDLVELVARRPLLPPKYMALLLKQDPAALQVRLDVATGLRWLSAERACCGRENRYTITDAGRSVLETRVAGQVDGAAARVVVEAL